MSKYKQRHKVKRYLLNIPSESGGEPWWERKQWDSLGDLHPRSAPEGRPKQIFLHMASLAQLLQKALLRSEFIFPIDNRHISRSVSAPRSVKSGRRCLRALLLQCLLSAAVTVPPPHQQHGGRFGFTALSDGFKNTPAV